MIKLKKEFSKIYDQYLEKIYRFVFLKVNSQEIAEDLTSEAFLRCWETFRTDGERIENIQAFLYQIARNLVTDHYRQKGRTQLVSADYVPVVDPRHNLKETAEKSSDLEIIKTALNRLNEDYQELVVWHYLEDLSVPEIAKITGKPEGTVRVTLHRALKALKNEIEEA